jgi:phosphoglycolate phosphatase
VLEVAGVGQNRGDALPRFLEIYDRRLLDHTRPYPGILDVLMAIPPLTTMAVLTNKPLAPSRRILDGLGLARFFTHVIGGDGPFPRKPDPAGLRALAALAPERPVMLVGDSPVDAATAAAAPATFAFAAYGFGAARFASAPDTLYRVNAPADLPAVIDRFARASAL